MSFADFTYELEGQKMFQIMELAKKYELQGNKVIHLEIGDPDFPSPKEAISAVKEALDRGETHYAQSSGIPEYKEACRNVTWKSRGFKPKDSQILVTTGANIQIYLAIASLLNPDDEIIIPDPSFVSYASIIKSCRGKVVRYKLKESEKYRINTAEIENLITRKTKAIIINSPHNPTGSVINEKIIKQIYELCEKYGLYLLSDEVYGRMIFSESKAGFHSPSSIDSCKKRTVLIHSLSKTYAMTGWRIGAVTGPTELIRRMSLLFETITSCVPPFIQYAATAALSKSSYYSFEMIKKYEERRNLLVDGINTIKGISCLKPEGTFYAFANTSKINKSSEEFSKKLLMDTFVASCPGIYFGPSGEGYTRFCFANSLVNIDEAVKRIKLFCERKE